MVDKVEILNKRLKEVVEKYRELKECGIDEEILEIYLQHKTKLSRKKIKELLRNVDEFYGKLVKGFVLDKLKEENGNERVFGHKK